MAAVVITTLDTWSGIHTWYDAPITNVIIEDIGDKNQ